jgi:hypothetical protein
VARSHRRLPYPRRGACITRALLGIALVGAVPENLATGDTAAPERPTFARLGVDAEVDPEVVPIEQRFIDDGMAKFDKLLRDHL